eukprot:TRINITY_DN42865_c0_g1_i1.p1 TRINITY_DN42865_c0_g1~~TRINITY_DN42865_c0_g1_i1.p1  ORF type:complete len:195 (+),score=75.94 TRINITY_DN42865_c0_g1_i1:66-650(+)
MLRASGAALFKAAQHGAGVKGAAAIGAPTRGLGRFFRRTKVLLSDEPQWAPHQIQPDIGGLGHWARSPFEAYNTFLAVLFIFCVMLPLSNTFNYYFMRPLKPLRKPLPGTMSVYSDIDDPDWRMKKEMAAVEAATGPRPYGYNRYMDAVKGMKVSDPAFKPYIPSEHGEGVGPHAGEIIAEQKRRNAAALLARQ